MVKTLTEKDYIDFGKYKGTLLKDVPASYLLWCENNNKITPTVRKYVRLHYSELLKRRKDEENERNKQK